MPILWGRPKGGRSRWPLRLALLVLAGAALFLWTTRAGSRNGVALENRSGQPIALLRVTGAGGTSTFKDVPAGREVTVPYLSSGDPNLDHILVDGQLADGTMIRGRFPGGEGLHLLILPGGQIMVRPSGKPSPS